MTNSRSTRSDHERKRSLRWIAAALGVAATLLCLRSSMLAESPRATRALEAKSALQPFKRQLKAALSEGLASGPESAIAICRSEAPRIAASLSSASLQLGRTSHRLRNPANAPKPWMQEILREWSAEPPAQGDFRTANLDAGVFGYAEPIFVQPPCLMCHGDALPPELASRIQTAYPDDRATGFREGDFRGLFWVELATQQPASE